MMPLVMKICNLFGWNQVAIVTFPDGQTAKHMKAYFDESGKLAYLYVLEPIFHGNEIDQIKLHNQNEFVDKIRRQIHIMILLLYPREIWTFLITAYDYGMLDKGKYAFITLEMGAMLGVKQT